MIVRKISFSDRFARYFITLVFANNIIGLFMALSKYREDGESFWSLLIFVLAVAHVTSLGCLIGIDIVELLVKRFFPLSRKKMLLLIIATVAITIVPSMWAGYQFGDFVSRRFNLGVEASFTEIARPGVIFAVLATTLSVIFMQWLDGLKAHYAQQASLLLAERRVLQARFDLLAKELHPHLLFNVIQNVLSLMTHDVAARKMLEELAVYYQEILLVIDKTSITLQKELTLCRHYMALQESRFKDISFTISDETEGRTAQMLLPPLLLQPLLENAVKFSMANAGSNKAIRVVIREKAHVLQIVITNPRKSGESQVVAGFSKGLKNTEQRLKEFFGDEARLSLSHGDETTSVTLDVPYDAQTTN